MVRTNLVFWTNTSKAVYNKLSYLQVIRYKYHRFSSGKYISIIVFPLQKKNLVHGRVDWVVFKSGVRGISDAIEGHLVKSSN